MKYLQVFIFIIALVVTGHCYVINDRIGFVCALSFAALEGIMLNAYLISALIDGAKKEILAEIKGETQKINKDADKQTDKKITESRDLWR